MRQSVVAQRRMRARTIFVVAAIAIIAAITRVSYAQDNYIYVDVENKTHHRRNELQYMEWFPDLTKDLMKAKEDALDLYTEFTSKAGIDLRNFLTNISIYADDAVRGVNNSIQYEDESNSCRRTFDARLQKIAIDAQRSATFNGENHHKYLLGHMIVFRMHLNKTEDYIKKCDRILRSCSSCEGTPKVKRWRRLAAAEIRRVRDDLQHSRKSYHDLITHARRKLNHFRKQIIVRATAAVDKYQECLRRGY